MICYPPVVMPGLTGLVMLAGEWFLMWQSMEWNAQETSPRLSVIVGIVLVYLIQRDEPTDA